MLGASDSNSKSALTMMILVGGALPFVAMILNGAGKISLTSKR